jgi:surface antigen
MRGLAYAISACALAIPGVALADAADSFGGSIELAPYLQCVPYARERSGVQIYGDARTWWDQAAGRYKRGATPRPGAVMTFRPSGNMVLGHVSAVAKVIDNRTVLLDHANWSPIDGRRGQIERGVKAVDVSPANDWSQVRVWYAPLQDLGTTAWPVAGFIYNERDSGAPLEQPRALASVSYEAPAAGVSLKPSKAFTQAFASLAEPAATKPVPRPVVRRIASAPAPKPRDPIDAALARYGS